MTSGNMQIGFFSYTTSSMPFEDFIPDLGRIGYQTVEIFTREGAHGFPGDLDPQRRREVKGMCEDAGLTISALACHTTHLPGDDEGRREFLDYLAEVMDLAGDWGVDILTTASGPVPEGFSKEQAWPAFIEAVREELELLKARGLRFAWEDHAHTNEFTYGLADMRRFLADIPDPALGVNLDASHFITSGDDPLQATRELAPRAYHSHLKGMRGKEFGIVGEPEDDFPTEAFLDILQAQGYTGPISVEIPPPLVDFPRGAEIAYEYLSGIME